MVFLDQIPLSSFKRKLFIFTAALCCMILSGIVFGWAPLLVLLHREGVYNELCDNDHLRCVAQEYAFATIFSVGITMFGVAAWPTGVLLDWCGPRFTITFGAVSIFIGSLIFAFSGHDALLGDMFCVGFGLMAMGGPGIILSMMHLCNLFPLYSGTILAIFNIMNNNSSIVFAIFELIGRLGVSYKNIFIGYSLIPALIIITAPFLWENKQYPEPAIPKDASGLAPLSDLERFVDQVKTREYFFGLFFTIIQIFIINLCNGSLNDRLHKQLLAPYSSPWEDPTYMSVLFGWMLPLGGILACFFVGRCLDMYTLATNLSILCSLTVAYCALCVSSNKWLIILSFFSYAYARAAMFGILCAYVSFVFGFKHFGKLWGSMLFVSGPFSMGVPTVDKMINESHSMNTVLAVMTSVAVATCVFPVWMSINKSQRPQRRPSFSCEDFSEYRPLAGSGV